MLLEVVMLVTLVVLAKVDADTEEVVIVVVVIVVLRSLPIHSFQPDFSTERSLRQMIAPLGVTATGPFSPV